MKTVIRIVLLLSILVFVWYLAADRMTPFTSNARVKAVITPVVPQVSGALVEVPAANGQLVETGEVLARIDARPYRIALEAARAQLDAAVQSIGASSADVAAAQAAVSSITAELENIRLQTARVFELERKGLISVSRGDEARAALSDGESRLAGAEADLARARQQLGPEGKDNPAIRQALAAVSKAELDLEWTELVAPTAGAVSDLGVAAGAYAKAGSPIMTFVDTEDVWVEAYLTENNMGHLSVGDPVEVTLDVQPGRVLRGRVESFSGAVSIGNETQPGGLAAPPRSTGWMRAPQRFPVRIVLPGYETGDPADDVIFQFNGQADVLVYATENSILNALGWAYVRALSWLSYAY
ncbi:HlyD family secretion protein [Tropicimonas isoalkanivorans]|uniref:Multidrug resistance efflux pump n=1 Tax=Tropicimonas isoalkanivorans TaxID=441112 RepID=A0A1I1INV3_9RHOB|nr:HlyD family secretion protein [Tropicimonas isoalkanivorans]SFC37392.1 Multidrug resistance efflux pump [Tropicimonas isoalkanivorans]